MKLENLSDWQLLSQSNHRDEAFAILFNRHKDYIFRLACGFIGDSGLADEITQEVFVRIFKGRKRWRPRAKFTTWIYRMTINTSRELVRRKNRDGKLLDKVKHENQKEYQVDTKDSRQATLQHILAELPTRQREAVVLRFYEKLSIRETAKIMGCRQGTVKSHLHKALKNLRNLLVQSEVE